jgi:hypothetical protein
MIERNSVQSGASVNNGSRATSVLVTRASSGNTDTHHLNHPKCSDANRKSACALSDFVQALSLLTSIRFGTVPCLSTFVIPTNCRELYFVVA